MKAKNRLAVGLTTALTLIAALVWLKMDDVPAPSRPAVAAIPPPDAAPASPGEAGVPGMAAPDVAHDPGSVTDEHSGVQSPRGFPRCQWGTTPMYDGTARVGERCTKSPHHEYSDETLEVLAYSDAEAARVLAMRLRHSDFNRALQYALRSVALSGGDTQVLVSAELWRLPQSESGPTALESASHGYVMNSLRSLVEHGEYRPYASYELRIRELADDGDATLRELDRFVYQLYDDIRQLELDITGNSSIGGDDDV